MGCGQLWRLVQALLPSTPPGKDFLQVCLLQSVRVCLSVCLSLYVCAYMYVHRAPKERSH